jgi:hypothetical protein
LDRGFSTCISTGDWKEVELKVWSKGIAGGKFYTTGTALFCPRTYAGREDVFTLPKWPIFSKALEKWL